jgi:hypothetical protein
MSEKLTDILRPDGYSETREIFEFAGVVGARKTDLRATHPRLGDDDVGRAGLRGYRPAAWCQA